MTIPTGDSSIGLETLAFELLEKIASFISSVDYHSLRISTKKIYLPMRHNVSFSIYKSQVRDMDVDVSEWMRLEYTKSDLAYRFLVQANQWGMVREWLRYLFYISDEDMIDTFSLGIYMLVPIDILVFLYDTGRILSLDHDNIAIQVFSSMGCVEKVYKLLQDTDVDPSANSNTALIHACGFGHIDVVRLLLPRVDPSALSNQALQAACELGHVDIARLLVMDGRVDVTDVNHWPLRLAVTNNHITTVEFLLNETDSDPSAAQNQCIRVASGDGNSEMVSMLLEDSRVDPSANDNESLITACKKGHLNIVKLLLEDPRVDPTARNLEAIRQCFENGNPHIAILLVNDLRLHTIKSIVKSFQNLSY
jgi:ankyrin repeat protein